MWSFKVWGFFVLVWAVFFFFFFLMYCSYVCCSPLCQGNLYSNRFTLFRAWWLLVIDVGFYFWRGGDCLVWVGFFPLQIEWGSTGFYSGGLICHQCILRTAYPWYGTDTYIFISYIKQVGVLWVSWLSSQGM